MLGFCNVLRCFESWGLETESGKKETSGGGSLGESGLVIVTKDVTFFDM